MSHSVPGTVVIYGPVYQRSGFGMLARVWTIAFHAGGLRVKVVPVDCNDQTQAGSLDDCDMRLLRSLEYTPLVPPVTAIFAYQPTYVWPRLWLEDPKVRIMLTTFDSSAAAASPPYRQIYICNQMDQTWLANSTEAAAWVQAGLDPERAKAFNWPHDWIENPRLGPPQPPARAAHRRFRFLHVSCYLPRRRLEVLLRAFFQEYPDDRAAELYLKMSFPGWHPTPGKPRRDFFALLENVRRETGSRAPVIVDESLGTRLELARLMDSCDAYVSPDTTMTAPVAEALIRRRLAIITSGWGVDLPVKQLVVVPNSDRTIPLTPEMADYMPHQRGKAFQALEIPEMRRALRTLFSMPPEEMLARTQAAYEFMRSTYSCEATLPPAVAALTEVWERKRKEPVNPVAIETGAKGPAARSTPNRPARSICWGGLQLFHGKVPTANREICLELLARGHRLSIVPGNGPFQIEELELKSNPDFERLADRFYVPLMEGAEFGISSRWHPGFQEGRAERYVLYNTWWSGAIPAEWRRPVDELVDEVWVPSEHVRQNFVLGGVAPERVQVIPFGVNPLVFQRQLPPFPLKTRKGFKFLFVGEASQRKGFDSVLLAYAKAFTAKDDVCLVVKDLRCEDYYGKSAGRELAAEFARNPGLPQIEYLDGMFDAPTLARLYASCHCFVQPFRAASNGQSILEAMACELPVIATRYGGPLEFCNDETALLLDAKEILQRPTHVGHWRVEGPQRYAEIQLPDLTELMRQVYHGSTRAAECARRAAAFVKSHATWAQTVDKIEERLKALTQAPPRAVRSPAATRAPGTSNPAPDRAALNRPLLSPAATPGTLLLIAPFHNRSGYGVAARALATTLHGAGVRLKCVPVDSEEPGIDDCDLTLLRQLENTPLTAPVNAVFFHVASPQWLKIELPPGSKRVLYTTFDSSAQGNAPPPDWIRICNAMDQVWLMTAREAEVFIKGGVEAAKVRVLACPHPWISNPLLPLPQPVTPVCAASGRFRFLSVAMFLPRRRWDTLLEAFLAEFAGGEPVELYLKVNFPSWHPVPGQPKRDLLELIERLRAKTGSPARIVVDDDLGTRRHICELLDSSQLYVSTDTSITAPVGEAFVRTRAVVLPDGLGAKLPLCEGAFVIPVDPALQRPVTEAELQYQPHHRGRTMPLLVLEDLRRTLRAGYEAPRDKLQAMGTTAALIMECTYGGAVVAPGFIKALRELSTSVASQSPAPPVSPAPAACTPQPVLTVSWQGSFLDFGSLSHVNRELTEQLTHQPCLRLTLGPKAPLPDLAQPLAGFQALADRLQSDPAADTMITVRHAWPPDWRSPRSGKLVVIQPWEFGALPQEWVRQSEQVTEFWVPSEYVRRCYLDSGIPADKVQVVPNGIDPAKFHPGAVPMKLATAKSFKFLFVGGTIGRKGVDILIETYLRSFTAKDDVCLVIKDFGGQSVYAGQTLEAQIKAAMARPDSPEILYLNDELAPEALPGLYTACDCLVHPYRGEGFGLPVLEAMACGLPAIITGGGAADDFAGDDFAYRIPAKRISIGDTVSGMRLSGTGWLLEPDGEALGDRMKWVIANRDAARAKGARASEYARRNWTWELAARAAQQRLQALAAQPMPVAAKNKHPTARKSVPAALPPCARIGNLDEARSLLGRRDFARAWETTRVAIQARPFHPEAFLLLAEIALAAGDSAGARQCAQHARGLAPGWKAPKQFLQKPLKGNNRPDWLKLPCGDDSDHAPRLSVCVIAKNEEQFLAQCLRSVKDAAAQIIVVDTGSTDRTVEIAKAHGAEVHSFAWCDDFSAARNAALERATGDWILILDADEELPPDQHAALQAGLNDPEVIACRLPLTNRGQEAEGRSCVPRLFRNAPGAFYHGRIHEQVFQSLIALSKGWGLKTGFGAAQLVHHGYAKELVKDRNKIERNLNLLLLAVNENPDDANLVMNLGLERVRSGDLAAGLTHYREAFQLMSALPPAEVVPELREALLTQFTCHLYKIRAHDEVAAVLTSSLAKAGGLTASLHFALGLAQFELAHYPAAADQMRQCLAQRKQPGLSPINTDILTAAPHHCLAMSLVKSGDAAGAEKAFQDGLSGKGRTGELALDYARFLADQNRPVEALQRLHEIVAQNATGAGAWRLGGEIALGRPDFLEFARDWTGEAVRCLPDDPVIAAQRAEVLLLGGQAANAQPLWERACNGARPPRALAAWILCSAAGSGTVPSTRNAAEETAVSRAFIEWYQRLVSAGARETILRLNSRVDAFRESLPTAARLLDSALAEAEKQPA